MILYQEVVDAVRNRDVSTLDEMLAEGVQIDEVDHQAPFPTPACLIAFDADVAGLDILRERSTLDENFIAYGFALGGHFDLLKTQCQTFNVKNQWIAKGIIKAAHIHLVDRCIDELPLSPEMMALFFAMDDDYLMAVHYQEKYTVDPQVLFEGFARSGHLASVLTLRLTYNVPADLIIFNFSFGGYPDLAAEFYQSLLEKEKSFIDLGQHIILGLALGGHRQEVEALRKFSAVTVNDIAMSYAMGGFYEAAEAYRLLHEVPAEHIARGFAFGGWQSYAEHYHRQFKVDSKMIAEGYRQGGHTQLLDAFELRCKNANKTYTPVVRFFASVMNQADDENAEVMVNSLDPKRG